MTSKHFVQLSTRKIYAFDGVIGIAADLALYEGWDGSLAETQAPLTLAEKREVAQIMLDRWHRLLESLAEPQQEDEDAMDGKGDEHERYL